MHWHMRLRHLPVRTAAGAFILNSGISKLSADAEKAKSLHQLATGSFPAFDKLGPEQFTKALAIAETSLGLGLLLPVVPPSLAGLGLASFSAGLLRMYAKTPGMRQEGSLRPSTQGTALAKDVWLFGIGLGLVLDALHQRRAG